MYMIKLSLTTNHLNSERINQYIMKSSPDKSKSMFLNTNLLVPMQNFYQLDANTFKNKKEHDL